MKTLIFMLTALLTVTAHAQKVSEKNIPQAVRSALQKRHPSSSDVKWEKEKENFEAEFKENNVAQSVLLNAQGAVLETEVEIPANELPAAVNQYLAQHHKGQKPGETAKITDATGKVTYEVEIKGKDLLFDSKGNLLTTQD